MGQGNEERQLRVSIVSFLMGLFIGIIAGCELGSLACSKFAIEGGFTKFMAYSLPMLACVLILVPLLRTVITAIANILGKKT